MYAFLYTTLMASLIAQHFIKAYAKPTAFGFKEGLCLSVFMDCFEALPLAMTDKKGLAMTDKRKWIATP